VKRAGAVEVDRDLIRLVVPDLPETTPGIDAEPGPLPPGAGDELSMGESTADDANESVAADIGDADIGQPEETAVHAADDDVLGIDAMAETANTGMVDGGPLGEELGAIDFSFEPDAHTGPLGPPVEFPSESFEIAAGAEPFPSRAIPIEQDSSAGSDFAPPSEEDVDLGVVADTFETESLES
jgi:hypothetical protein